MREWRSLRVQLWRAHLVREDSDDAYHPIARAADQHIVREADHRIDRLWVTHQPIAHIAKVAPRENAHYT